MEDAKAYVSVDNYLLQKVVHVDTLKRELLLEDLDFSHVPKRTGFGGEEYWGLPTEKDDRALLYDLCEDNPRRICALAIAEMCHPYDKLREGDRFFYYNDIRALSGTAGVLRVRDGYVVGTKVLRMS